MIAFWASPFSSSSSLLKSGPAQFCFGWFSSHGWKSNWQCQCSPLSKQTNKQNKNTFPTFLSGCFICCLPAAPERLSKRTCRVSQYFSYILVLIYCNASSCLLLLPSLSTTSRGWSCSYSCRCFCISRCMTRWKPSDLRWTEGLWRFAIWSNCQFETTKCPQLSLL